MFACGLLSLEQQPQKLLGQDTEGKRNKAHSCDPGEHRAGRQELTRGQLFILQMENTAWVYIKTRIRCKPQCVTSLSTGMGKEVQ